MKFDISAQYVQRCLEQIGIPRRPKGAQKDVAIHDKRKEEIASLFRSGVTPEQIGRHFGFSRTIVWRYLVEIRKSPDVDESLKYDFDCAQYARRTGLSVDQFPSLADARKAWIGFRDQRNSAVGARGIAWEMTFAEWWQIWKESGHWHARGHTGDGYVMGRLGDIGPYKVGNVHIITSSQNLSDAWSYCRTRPVGRKKKK
jgi:hypothetical protein